MAISFLFCVKGIPYRTAVRYNPTQMEYHFQDEMDWFKGGEVSTIFSFSDCPCLSVSSVVLPSDMTGTTCLGGSIGLNCLE